ncbi:HigA family addiction module antitoxin [Methylomonas sp. CM2]|uniref:HigA family addiction module antitoxin n=1 Tax=Methylomonas sp. CM2 TaxID=3417647 RepID=UPI003CF313AF
MSKSTRMQHPGIRIKSEVIPPKMSVTKAAQIIGVGRPALSNLLNGKAALSPDMAARLSKAFNFPLTALMDMQAAYDSVQATQAAIPVNTKKHIPPFLAIKANEIVDWGLLAYFLGVD